MKLTTETLLLILCSSVVCQNVPTTTDGTGDTTSNKSSSQNGSSTTESTVTPLPTKITTGNMAGSNSSNSSLPLEKSTTESPLTTDRSSGDTSIIMQSSTQLPSSSSSTMMTTTEQDQLSDNDNNTDDATSSPLPTSSVTGSSETTNSSSPPMIPPQLDRSWMDYFLRLHHFDGLYEYDGGRYSFDFVVTYVHPLDVYTLVAKFYDQDGAIIEMNGTSTDGVHIIFKQCNTYSADFRFTALSNMVLDGMLVTKDGWKYYTGNITRPLNSSFTWFHINKGLGPIVTGDAASTRTAIIIVIPASLAFLAVIGTTGTLCWASKKGLFGRRHKSYLLFKDNPVGYESEAETIHI